LHKIKFKKKASLNWVENQADLPTFLYVDAARGEMKKRTLNRSHLGMSQTSPRSRVIKVISL
jgi:hypothetical protein